MGRWWASWAMSPGQQRKPFCREDLCHDSNTYTETSSGKCKEPEDRSPTALFLPFILSLHTHLFSIYSVPGATFGAGDPKIMWGLAGARSLLAIERNRKGQVFYGITKPWFLPRHSSQTWVLESGLPMDLLGDLISASNHPELLFTYL